MTTTFKRRWQFSARTLFVVVTAFACWMAYEMNWIRQRRSLLKCGIALPVASTKVAPAGLWIFGEPGQATLMIQGHGYEDSVRAKALFPEARIVCSGPDFD
jgi:hypothetical protein